MKQLKITKQITNRENESLNKYLLEIGKVDLITADEEVDLARRIKEGDMSALDKLTKANLRFVVSVAKQYQHRGLSLNDLINEGNVGLIKAGMRFDETRGFKFISYAVWWIRQSIIQALAEQSRVVRLPMNKVGQITKIWNEYGKLEQSLERDPSVQELAESLEMTPENVAESLSTTQRTISADAPAHFDDHVSLIETYSDASASMPDSELIDVALKSEIQSALRTLSSREMQILVLYFGLDNHDALTLEEIGERLSLTRERVRQIKQQATNRLRDSSKMERLKQFLG